MSYKYMCPKCKSRNTRRAIIIDDFNDLYVGSEKYIPEKHGSPYQCNECNNVFVVGIERMPYIEHIKLIQAEMNKKEE